MEGQTKGDCLLLFDGTNVVRTIYEAIPGEDSPERAQGAVQSAVASFHRALRKHRPTHALAPFDYGGRQWRHDIFPGYHASRKPMAQELRSALPELYDKLRAIGLPVASVPEVEGDDVIATVFTHWTAKPRGPAIVLANDKDMLELVTHGAWVRSHFDKDDAPWRDRDYVLNKFGVPPELVQDYHALVGDSTDDVPGVDKVGHKTAVKWLQEYGSLDGVLENRDKLTGIAGKNLRDQADRALMSRQLVALKKDVHVGVTWNSLRIDKH